MSDLAQIIIAIVAAAGSILGVVLTNNKSNREMNAKIDKTQAVFEAHVTEQVNGIKTDVHRLETKQDKYNNLIERTFVLEKTTELQSKDIKLNADRIKALEGGK